MKNVAAAKFHFGRRGMPFLEDLNNSSLAVRLEGTPTSTWPSTQPPHFGHTPWPQVMSQQSDTAQSYQPNSYPSYSAPSMAAQFNYPPPEGQGQANSPSGSNMAHPNISLPPIRSIDGISQPQHQQSQQGGQPSPMGSAMPPNMGQYYGQGQYPPPTSDPNAPVRYPIPPDGRQMSGGRHKKEIKRRTKTGCLTCRKRRIKCDETHPACRNCQKSKRDCLGYDPIFKSQPGPTAIQPALGAASSTQSANSSPYPPPPQGYVHAGSQGYGPAGTDSETSTVQPYDYGAAIDPTLEGGAAQMQDSKEPLGTGTPYPSAASDQQGHRAKRTKIEELLCIRGVSPPPPAPPTTISAATREEIKHIWITVYAPGIDKFLETKWFGLRGMTHLMQNSRLCDQFQTLIQRYAIDRTHPSYYQNWGVTQSLEATVVWAMIGMCRQVAGKSPVDEQDSKEGVRDAAKRMEIFENLVTGEYLDSSSAPSQASEESNGTALNDQLKTRERDFWRLVHTFLTIQDDEASAAKQIDDTLTSCRGLLDSRENRDVIYSVMVARHVGARISEFPENLQQPANNDEDSARTKVFVAKKFIEDESNGKGTNQVVQRLCGMAHRSSIIRR
ncbi:hypothetical protein HO173_004988 [Letharia columbiana]|uniref:Zn(2)-C6 fungal-type domain-containing protein n=1 Tax=Letharia columbiana TaxID=112416 RepID=A0A8H6FXS1_9LECA|nr:uncharacterized protein HO173_004988 [Letharia columbiana]KAF6236697.1 hypothetical protein HO173_004988 [Letharia columbiana]